MLRQNLLFDSLLNFYTFHDYDNNEYTSTIIGSQEWIVQNLKTTHYADGTIIPHLDSSIDWINDVSGGFCEYNSSTGLYKLPYGYLYNWYAVDNSHGLAYFKKNGIYEPGWRIASYNDCSILINYIGDISTGGKLKEMGLNHWFWPNVGATNQYGFTAIGSGRRLQTIGNYNLLNYLNFVWTNTMVESSTNAYFFHVDYNNTDAFLQNSPRGDGYSVRCVRDVSL